MRPCTYTLVLGALAAGLTACDDSTDPDADPLPDNAATAVGLTVRDNVEASIDDFYPARLFQPLSTGAAQDPCATASSPADGPEGLCTACFTGNYPIPVEAQVQGKDLLEGLAPPR